MNEGIVQALDRFKVSNTAAAIIIGQVAYNLGHDIGTLKISEEYIRKQRIKYREKIYRTIREQFPTNAVFTVHWDGKILQDCTSKNNLTCNRLAIILSSRGNSKVLGIPKVSRQTGAVEGEAVYSALLDWHVDKNVMAMCFDTTSSNTSTSIGACTVIQQKLNRPLLHLACRHHMMELLAGAAFKVAVEPLTSGPKVLLFDKFRATWSKLQHDNFEYGTCDPDVMKNFPTDIRSNLINFIKDQNTNSVDTTRHDYIDMLKSSLLFFGEELPNYKISQPGAVSHARWMAKIIYSPTIFLFRKQFAVQVRTYKIGFALLIFVLSIFLYSSSIERFTQI